VISLDTTFGILLFVLVYGVVACIIYDDVAGERSRLRPLLARGTRHQATNRPPTTIPSAVASRVH
jgi:hypothetical protein